MLRSIILLYSLLYIASCAPPTNYHEQLNLKPLPQSSLLASFLFSSYAKKTAFDAQHFGVFPRSLGQILQHAHARELHLRFSTGRWDAESWGVRPWNGTREGGTGVELWAWVDAVDDEEANSRWLILTNALSGLFCASLNFVDSTRTTRPIMTFEPQGSHDSRENLHLLHGTLPREVVCTENLTPFLKLLPCKGKAGASSLLDGHKLFDASWQSMAIDIRPTIDKTTDEPVVEMAETIDMVLNMDRSKRPRNDPIPRPLPIQNIPCDTSKHYHGHGDTCFPLLGPQLPAFTLEDIFGRPLKGSCSLSGEDDESVASLCLEMARERKVQITTEGNSIETHLSDSMRCYQMPAELDFDLHVEEQLTSNHSPDPAFHVERVLTGSGQERGGLSTVFTNPTMRAINFVYLESLPWFTKMYLHTFSTQVRSLSIISFVAQDFEPVKGLHYQPGVDRSRPTHLELEVEIPPMSRLTIQYDIEKSILRYAEYPPDANRGFDIAPGIVRIMSDEGNYSHYLRTTSLLLYLPTPDFSMPYNTIILTSTVIALGFGTIFNILVRRFVSDEEAEALGQGGLREKIRQRIAALRVKFAGKEVRKKTE